MPSSTLRSPLRAALTLILAVTVCLVLARPAGAVSWAPCIDTIDDVQCARFVLPADRTGGFAGATSVQVYKAGATEGPRLGTLVVLAGGPGQASFGMLDYMLSLFPGANRYDLIAIDQRGTGRSEPLNCPRIEFGAASVGPILTRNRRVTECATALGPARAGYDTAESVSDIEAVRAELAVDQISLFGVSYGTKLAMAYATTYPTHVRSLLLDSVLPVSEPGPFDTASVAAMRGSLDQVCANGYCRGVLASPQTSLRRMIQLLATEPVTGYLENKNDERPTKIVIGPSQVLELLFAADFNLYVYEQLP
ncbi:MAG: alpha/beta hydrolase, partial [Thermoleophilia bacterium]|nr:alpha/beta hydrolase [Thermoleophilia bacterium]